MRASRTVPSAPPRFRPPLAGAPSAQRCWRWGRRRSRDADHGRTGCWGTFPSVGRISPPASATTGSRRLGGVARLLDRDHAAAPAVLELHDPRRLGEDRVVLADADADTRM